VEEEMSKDNKEGKIQFVFVNVEGEQETLREALRQVGTVLNRGMNPPARTLVALPVSQTPAIEDGKQNGHAAEQVYELVDTEGEQDEATQVGTGEVASVSRSKRERKAPRIPPLLQNFDPKDAEVSLEDFVKQKDTSTQTNKYLVLATWFQKYKNEDEIGPSHIFTCFPLVDWPKPDDMGQPFRDMKKRDHYFENGSKNGLWKITIIGLNVVDKMTPKVATEV
jgi:hypothetical protein